MGGGWGENYKKVEWNEHGLTLDKSRSLQNILKTMSKNKQTGFLVVQWLESPHAMQGYRFNLARD